ncbi:amidohydrolase 2 [Thozetella sp. PMI_491]|nr:amidohydrolase 2 [Thozetella sp. PMI_491]
MQVSRLIVCWTLTSAYMAISAKGYSTKISKIIRNADRDGLDLPSLPFADAAFRSIEAIQDTVASLPYIDFSNATRVDVHIHAVPDFYRALVPLTGEKPTPAWDLATHLSFMANNSIAHGILSISTPGSAVYPGNQAASTGIARLLNEWLAELAKALPQRFGFYSVAPLPYVNAALKESKYGLTELGAKGINLLTNHEGLYLGNPALQPFFEALNAKNQSIALFVHPTLPMQRINGTLVTSNPTIYMAGLVEFYFETARTLMDLTLTQTLMNYTNLKYIFNHCGGAYPSIEDRYLRSSLNLLQSATQVYNTRIWYDSAGPTYFAQVKGLLAYHVPTSQLVFGSDYPYGRIYEPAFAAIQAADFLSSQEKTAIFSTNWRAIFGI